MYQACQCSTCCGYGVGKPNPQVTCIESYLAGDAENYLLLSFHLNYKLVRVACNFLLIKIFGVNEIFSSILLHIVSRPEMDRMAIYFLPQLLDGVVSCERR